MKESIRSFIKETFSNIEVILLLFFMWIILFEEINLFVVVTGVLMSLSVVVFTNQFLLEKKYKSEYAIGLWTIIKYVIRLFYEMFISAIDVIPNITFNETYVKYVTVETQLENEFLIAVLANSVTLTPGTVTIEQNGKTLRILSLDAPGYDEQSTEVLPLKLEAILMDYEAKKKKNTRK